MEGMKQILIRNLEQTPGSGQEVKGAFKINTNYFSWAKETS